MTISAIIERIQGVAELHREDGDIQAYEQFLRFIATLQSSTAWVAGWDDAEATQEAV